MANSRDLDDALMALFANARRMDWCNHIGCTTCGSLPFRDSVRPIKAMVERFPGEVRPGEFRNPGSTSAFHVIAALKRLESQGFIQAMLDAHGRSFTFDLGLLTWEFGFFATSEYELEIYWADSPTIWNIVKPWVTYSEARRRRSIAAQDCDEKTAEQREQERIERAIRHEIRMAAQSEHNAELRNRLATLAALPAEAQLELLSNPESRIPLGAIVVTQDIVNASNRVSEHVAKALLSRLGARKGPWRTVTKILRSRLTGRRQDLV